MPEYCVDGVQQVGTKHTHFIDDQQFDLLQQFAFGFEIAPSMYKAARCMGFGEDFFLPKAAVGWKKGAEGQLEEGVEGDASRVDGCNACWCGDHSFLMGVRYDVFQKRRLSRSGFTGEENMSPRAVDKARCQVFLLVLRHGWINLDGYFML